ncbi:hypothetical protein PLESTB_000972100 [Pleodorina starrii]|uniref:Uncharacterized protein n=1 Tax=Pleodorina starrii TaxID=330485 RepID=A0A9W6F3Y3_9CHLO|nr:hypothetical protein PLESTM_001634400 [Pleodorina starrii]GLC55319.1 hypothetical protein PLESTB_000972100 [Pleodorina starrii]GLC76316.1 hypothetical protein PLESTF_001765800 [Pleodorina starrii]
MNTGGLDALYLEYQQDWLLPNISGAECALPSSDLTTTGFGKHGDGEALNQHQRRPRGGQKPLRPRQQQLHQLEAELEQKLRDLKAAQAEREKLQQRIKVLEIVLPIRDRQLQLLKQRRQAAHVRPSTHIYTLDAAAQLPCAPHLIELRPSASSGGISSSSSGSETGQSSDHAQELGSGPGAEAAICQRPAALHRTIQRSAHDTTKVETYMTGQVVPFTSVPAHSRVPGHVLRQLSTLWKQWVREAGLVLHAYDARPHDPGPQLKLSQLYEQLAPTFHSLRLEHPSLLTELMYVNLETGEREEPPPDSFWIPVAQGLRLSPEQVADAKAALALYNDRAAGAQEERRRLAAQLGSSLALLQGMAPLHGHGPGPAERGQLMLGVDQVVGQLHRNVKEQGNALELVKDFMSNSIFSLVQTVRACVLSHPYLPDMIAVLSSLDDATAPHAPRQQ